MIFLLILDYDYNKAQAVVTKITKPFKGEIYLNDDSTSVINVNDTNVYAGGTKNYYLFTKTQIHQHD